MATTKHDQGPELDAESTELAPADSEQSMTAALMDHARTLQPESTEQVQERILANIIRSGNITDLLNAGSATPAQELYDVPLHFTGIRASESEYAEGPELYLHVDATILSNGDHVTVSCGARDVVVKLLVADQRGWFPFDAVITQSKKATADGFYPVFLRPIDPHKQPF